MLYGKYRARVVNVNDPEKRGRIRVVIPSVLSDGISNWCDPCFEVAYDNGGDFCLPKKGETVWVEFEEGNISRPVYSGNWFSTNSAPVDYAKADKIRIIGFGKSRIIMDEETETMTLSVNNVELVLNAENIGKLNQLLAQSQNILSHITHPIK